mgnify:CR=1 FL=1
MYLFRCHIPDLLLAKDVETESVQIQETTQTNTTNTTQNGSQMIDATTNEQETATAATSRPPQPTTSITTTQQSQHMIDVTINEQETATTATSRPPQPTTSITTQAIKTSTTATPPPPTTSITTTQQSQHMIDVTINEQETATTATSRPPPPTTTITTQTTKTSTTATSPPPTTPITTTLQSQQMIAATTNEQETATKATPPPTTDNLIPIDGIGSTILESEDKVTIISDTLGPFYAEPHTTQPGLSQNEPATVEPTTQELYTSEITQLSVTRGETTSLILLEDTAIGTAGSVNTASETQRISTEAPDVQFPQGQTIGTPSSIEINAVEKETTMVTKQELTTSSHNSPAQTLSMGITTSNSQQDGIFGDFPLTTLQDESQTYSKTPEIAIFSEYPDLETLSAETTVRETLSLMKAETTTPALDSMVTSPTNAAIQSSTTQISENKESKNSVTTEQHSTDSSRVDVANGTSLEEGETTTTAAVSEPNSKRDITETEITTTAAEAASDLAEQNSTDENGVSDHTPGLSLTGSTPNHASTTESSSVSVSYTHLTLPTICSV